MNKQNYLSVFYLNSQIFHLSILFCMEMGLHKLKCRYCRNPDYRRKLQVHLLFQPLLKRLNFYNYKSIFFFENSMKVTKTVSPINPC